MRVCAIRASLARTTHEHHFVIHLNGRARCVRRSKTSALEQQLYRIKQQAGRVTIARIIASDQTNEDCKLPAKRMETKRLKSSSYCIIRSDKLKRTGLQLASSSSKRPQNECSASRSQGESRRCVQQPDEETDAFICGGQQPENENENSQRQDRTPLGASILRPPRELRPVSQINHSEQIDYPSGRPARFTPESSVDDESPTALVSPKIGSNLTRRAGQHSSAVATRRTRTATISGTTTPAVVRPTSSAVTIGRPYCEQSKCTGFTMTAARTGLGYRVALALAVLTLSCLSDWRAPSATQLSPGQSNGYEASLLGLSLAPSSLLVAGQQYKPEWPQKVLEQEIFLLNLEDGYFGCQVNASQDFLQLFELSRLCDGQPQCYLGSDELTSQLKCRDRNQCETYNSTALVAAGQQQQQEVVKCVNGVCLDGLCYCNDGFGGKACDIPDENECKFRPCDVFAHCTNTMGSYYCSCFPGYDGDGMHCQDINECEIPSLRALCADNSECVNLPGHFVCKCRPGYQQSGLSQSSLTGAPIGNATVQCADIDECSLAGSCGKGAICENLPGTYRCACPPGFTGDPAVECIDMDECRNNPCGIGAQCTNLPGGYRCSCAPGHERNPAAPAHLFGTIQFSELQQQQQLAGELKNGNSSLIACLDVNECLAGGKPVCGVGAQCINTQGGYFCQCPPGFSGNPKVACLDIDECASHACGPSALCKNTPGSYKCECKPGYTGNAYLSDGCQDEDECLRKDACGVNAQCFNTLGGYQCSCQSGYAGDPYKECVDIDECRSAKDPCGPGAQCLNLEGGYKCTCPDKYLARGTPEMGCERAAVDIGCTGDFDCTQNAQCINTTCQCKLGYQTSGIECVDVDECAVSLKQQQQQQQQQLTASGAVKAFTRLNLASLSAGASSANSSSLASVLCGPEATCRNTEGAYRCECQAGYEPIEPNVETSKCRDVNECERSNPCGQNSKCFNTDGAYKCLCNDGFIPIDQDAANGCKSPCDGVNCGQHAACKPHGEEAACVCKPGFTFDPNNIKLGCVDINECDTNYGPSGLCGQRATCTNVPGSYRCACPSGYAGDAYRYCEDINECDRKFGVFGQCGELAVCTNKPGSFSCACAPGYTGDPKTKCTDVDECDRKFGPNGKCGVNAICTNTPGKYACQCPPGYSGDAQVRCVPERPTCVSAADCGANQVCQSGRCACPFSQQQADGEAAVSLECRHPCDKTECGPHATCQLDSENQPLCVCDTGYMAPSDGHSGCMDVNECIQGVTLSGMTPISALSGGSVALGPSAGAATLTSAGNSSTGSHPCGRNALCRNQPGSFDCVCPPGYSGDAYVACSLDVRNQAITTTTTTSTSTNATSTTTSDVSQQQQQQQQQMSTTTTAGGQSDTSSGPVFGNYQQEPRTTACGEPCGRDHVCADGQCVKVDSCRDNRDCRSSQACERVNQALGSQCVNVCDTLAGHCGPGAKCTPRNHKPVCSCNTTAGFAGNPYDLVNGCRQQQITFDDSKQTTLPSPGATGTSAGTTATTTSGGFSTLTTKQDQIDLLRTTQSNAQPQSGGGGGDISTVSIDYTAPPSYTQQQRVPPIGTTSTFVTSSNATSVTSSMDELQRQQVLEQEQQQQQQQQHSSKQPNQPLIAYELQTTPIVPQFETSSLGTTKGSQATSFSQFEQQQQQQQQYSNQINTTSSPQFGTTLPRQRPTQTTQTNSATQMVAGNKMSQQQQQLFEQRQDVQQSTTTTKSSQQQQQQQQTSQQVDEARGQTTSDDVAQVFSQFSNKSALSTNGVSSQYKQVACTSDQHCPGNLFCLSLDELTLTGSKSGAGNQRICGCPVEYGRDGDYCYMHRVNCTSSSACKAREECVQSLNLATGNLFGNQRHQQVTSISQQFALNSNTNAIYNSQADEYTSGGAGICICPRGYKLTVSGQACVDRNECDEGTPCALGAVCQNKIGSYECVCPPGKVGEPYTKTCEPVVRADECQSDLDCASDRECDLGSRKCVSPCHVCGPRAICTAANHAAICLCPPRYTGNAIDQVYGCQEPLPTTTVAPPTNQPARQPPPTTPIGVPITTLLPPLSTVSTSTPTPPAPGPTTLAPLETTTAEQPEYRTIPPTELFVMCLADGIHVDLQLEKFDGIIYVKGHSQDPKCRKLVMSNGSPNQMVDFRVQFGHCDLIHRDGEASFVLVIQKHPKLVTYRARAYHVKCVYNTGERTVTLGFNVSMITTSGTIANTGPPPTCLMSITALDGREVTSAEIGQDLLLRVDVQPDSIYGGFARSCEAKTMDDEGEYQYEVTDANGCATDASIFSDWKYDQQRKSLVARFNAFKFPSSNNLRFQCNIRVCFGSCPAVNCNGIDAYGKRRRRREAPALSGPNATIFNEEAEDTLTEELIVTDSFKEGALREEIMVQSNAILTFDKKEASLPQQRPPVEDIEFVCLPRLGIVLSILLTTLLALLALAIATSCWCFAKKKRDSNRLKNASRPLPHPHDFPNPLMRSPSASTLRESIYGP